MNAAIPALYFDGKTSRVHHVMLSVDDGIAAISGDAERSCAIGDLHVSCLLYTSPSPRDLSTSRMPSSA